jgi:hypothetical protein
LRAEKKERNLAIVDEYRANPDANHAMLAKKHGIDKANVTRILAIYLDWEERYALSLIKRSAGHKRRKIKNIGG